MRIKLALVSLLLIALVGCSAPTTNPFADAAPTSPAEAREAWSYEGETGPANWGNVKPICATGRTQSPIDIATTQPQDVSNITLSYQPSNLRIVNKGHTVQLNYDAGSFITIDGQRYNVDNIHYHLPSEHRVDGKSFAAELHIVHKDGDKLAVIGILIEVGAANPAYDPFVTHLPDVVGPEVAPPGVTINAADLLPSLQTTFRYTGSLTTPPCTEGVAWNVMITPVQISAEQLAALQRLFEGNNRPVQDLNERTVIEDATP